jgi:crotonobetainyl-CoA:carnitine CoA-transferase CaiB-like acyl-CoA transferase
MRKTQAEATGAGPLSGYKVLDLTTVVMGPAATQMLGDLGAEVIKIEAPEGDSLRRIGPARNPSMGTLFLQSNRNKKSRVLDLKDPKDKGHLLALAAEADVLMTNIRPKSVLRLGLDYTAISKINPAIIYCQMVGYGTDGPYAGQAVYDDLIQAAAGVSGLFEAVDGDVRYAPLNICDRVTGLYAVIAVLSALVPRAATGKGQEIEVPMFETMAGFVLADNMGGKSFVPPLGKAGYGRLLSRFRGPYPTRDGHLALVVYTDRDWRRFTDLVDRPDILENPHFANQSSRTEHAESCGKFLAEVLPSRTTAQWVGVLRAIDIPCAPVNSLDDLFDDEHLQTVGMFEEFDHPTEGRIKMARSPLKFSATPASIRSLAPNLGQDDDVEFSSPETPLPATGSGHSR